MSGWMVGLILLVSAVELLLAVLILRRMTWLQRIASAFLLTSAVASVTNDPLKEVEK